MLPKKRRRARADGEYHDASYKYKVRIKRNVAEEIDVCSSAFTAIHGITRSRLIYIQQNLNSYGVPPVDRRGKHYGQHRK